ncbi:amidase [Conexibacter arvalis]|uniref:Asp-tRNA(Asn)/Glu-tRNA(Gln) amidotransferase A subunit family amidase n=1 Tax=Conexibacter arvalis TaxID=912552 RepID=A0A840ILU3_9ACTN|nr:amidase [Conexibacter arvalis]MBB4664908.1 Asp-tRNA(Asn)/Glu-tRNA(Gln) amidotransferase A subunit family amidase [Conexibacter arvalis]
MEHRDYAELDGLGLAAAIAGGELTAAEALEAAQRRAQAVGGRINAIVRPLEAQAAARLDEPLTGPFAGVPFLLKDLGQQYAGVPSSYGCRALSQLPAMEHATVVQRWLDAGVVVFGRTNTPEFGAKGITEPELFGPARNPWDADRTPGGSSGGSAAAVAAGIVPVAGASDGGGSIRIPSACCGLFGLKAGRGLVPHGPIAGEPLLGAATDGVVSRTVRDSAAMLDVLAGPDPTVPFAPATHGGSYLDEVGRDPGRLRIGFHASSAINSSVDREAVTAVTEAAALLESLGHHVEAVASPVDDAALARDFLTLWFANVAYEVGHVRQLTGAGREGFEQDTLIMAALGSRTTAVEFVAAVERRHEHVRALADFHDRFDLLLTPTLATPPPRIGQFDTPKALRPLAETLLRTRTAPVLRRLGIVERMIDDNLGWVPYTQLANLTGRPAASVPLHWTAEGLPLGVQFVAPLGGEATLLRLAAQLEEAKPWKDRRPPLL